LRKRSSFDLSAQSEYGSHNLNNWSSMPHQFVAADWEQYRIDYHNPFQALEAPEEEIAIVDKVLARLAELQIIPHTRYDRARFETFRQAVIERFEIPWTAITPRMQCLLWALNAIRQPRNMLAAGIFCGNTFISNAGTGVGPDAVYQADNLVGIEIKLDEAARAERNVRAFDETGVAYIVAGDAVQVVGAFDKPIELLYLDANGTDARSKGIYLDILQAGLAQMPQGALVLAHNSVNCAEKMSDYLDFVRVPQRFTSLNVIFDVEGLEVSAV